MVLDDWLPYISVASFLGGFRRAGSRASVRWDQADTFPPAEDPAKWQSYGQSHNIDMIDSTKEARELQFNLYPAKSKLFLLGGQ